MITFCGKPVSLTLAKPIKQYKKNFDRLICTEQTDLTPGTVIEPAFELDLVEEKIPRTIVLLADVIVNDQGDQQQVRYELCSFLGRQLVPLSFCHLMFEPPFENLQPVTTVDLRTSTKNPDEINQYEMFKFGDRFFERKMSRIEWMQNVRNQLAVDEESQIDTLDFKCLTDIENKVGEEGVGWFATWFDQIFATDKAQTAVWLLKQCDHEDLRHVKDDIESVANRAKRLKQ